MVLRNLLIVLCCVVVVGCERIPAVRRFYYSYIDPPPTISLDATKLSKGEQQLAAVTMPLYIELDKVIRFLAVNDKVKYGEWFRALAENFPWIQGAGIINPSGSVVYAQPEQLFEETDFSPLLAVKTTGLRLQQKAMFLSRGKNNAFVFIAQPVFTGENITEYRVVCFELARFADFAQGAENLYFIGDGAILWQGENVASKSKVQTINWKKYIKNRVFGKLSSKGVESWYIVVYLGSVPFIFAVDVV